jgi:SAM-dependent methyltransferase
MTRRTVTDATDTAPPALFAFFERMPRQGPGSEAVTAAIYERIRDRLPDRPVAADMGCGSGAAGIVLAARGAQITGVDVHQPYLECFRAAAAARGMADRVDTLCASMVETGWDAQSLDLVWSEGAVFTVGFDAALAEFRRLLKPGGVVVISDATWFQDPARAPDELRAFWRVTDEGIRTVAGNLAAAEREGWRFLHAERLADAVWEDEFYDPMEKVIAEVKAAGDPDLVAIARRSETEMDLFRRYKAYYGYVFHVLERP